MEELNIVELIENNPITKLSKDYNVKLLTKIKITETPPPIPWSKKWPSVPKPVPSC